MTCQNEVLEEKGKVFACGLNFSTMLAVNDKTVYNVTTGEYVRDADTGPP